MLAYRVVEATRPIPSTGWTNRRRSSASTKPAPRPGRNPGRGGELQRCRLLRPPGRRLGRVYPRAPQHPGPAAVAGHRRTEVVGHSLEGRAGRSRPTGRGGPGEADVALPAPGDRCGRSGAAGTMCATPGRNGCAGWCSFAVVTGGCSRCRAVPLTRRRRRGDEDPRELNRGPARRTPESASGRGRQPRARHFDGDRTKTVTRFVLLYQIKHTLLRRLCAPGDERLR